MNFDPEAWDRIGVVGILVVGLLLFAFDVIITTRAHNRRIADKDEQLRELRAGLASLAEVGITVKSVLETVQRIAEKREERASREEDPP